VDIKGGVLLRGDEDGELTCRDIGVATSSEEVQRAESRGKPILFNCATGLFSLEYLDRKLDDIIKDLPLRVSEQHKDAGIYSQAEQVTWEIIDLMEYPAVIAVNKHQRFLAAKLLSESIMSTRASRYAEELLERNSDYRDFCEVSLKLEQGFYSMMEEVFALKLTERRWR
jgi:UDP-N-acetylglucosamine pyrophosphorylase